MATRRREFLTAGVAALGGAAIPVAAEPGEPPRVFDAHLHCPADSGELWQWHTVTPTFRDFVAHLDRTGVQRGIINSQRAQSNGGTPADFIAGNREVARGRDDRTGPGAVRIGLLHQRPQLGPRQDRELLPIPGAEGPGALGKSGSPPCPLRLAMSCCRRQMGCRFGPLSCRPPSWTGSRAPRPESLPAGR